MPAASNALRNAFMLGELLFGTFRAASALRIVLRLTPLRSARSNMDQDKAALAERICAEVSIDQPGMSD
jgi:hypothetical protein